MDTVYQAALRAPDHAWLRPSRFIEVTGKGLDKLSDLFLEFATERHRGCDSYSARKIQICSIQSTNGYSADYKNF